MNIAPTIEQYTAYQAAFDHFNEHLFDGALSPVTLVFSTRCKSARGYYRTACWQNGEETIAEISLNPDVMSRPFRETMGTFVHEMAHAWQDEYGEPSRGYHNREWADKMEAIGLMPSSTGEPDGKRTGAKMTHYILDGGPFDRTFETLPESARLPWSSGSNGEAKPTKTRSRNKVKYSCNCGSNIWAKPDLEVLCPDCGVLFVAEGELPRLLSGARFEAMVEAVLQQVKTTA